MTVEVEAATHALQWIVLRLDIQTTHAIIRTDSVSMLQNKSEMLNGKPRLAFNNIPHPCEDFCGYSILDVPKSKEMTEQIDWSQSSHHKWLIYLKI